MSYTRCYYHIVFRTKGSVNALPIGPDVELYKFIWGLVKNKSAILFQINGMPDHLHLFVSLSPTISLADFVKEVKISSNNWLKEHRELFPYFTGWACGYAGLSYGENDKENIIAYIKRQKEHHNRETFSEEIRRVLAENGIPINEEHFEEDI